LFGVLVAGGLLWVATRVDGNSTWRYWATLGVLAGAGLVLALTQRAAYAAWAVVTVPAFLLAFVPAVVAAGWIAIAGMPNGNWLHDHVVSWSSDIGIRGLVSDLTRYVVVMAFGIGALVASAPGLVAREPVADKPAVDEAPAATPTASTETTTVAPAAEPVEEPRSRHRVMRRRRDPARV
jgi:hypothetical protein